MGVTLMIDFDLEEMSSQLLRSYFESNIKLEKILVSDRYTFRYVSRTLKQIHEKD